MKTNDLFISLKSEPGTADAEDTQKGTWKQQERADSDQQGAVN